MLLQICGTGCAKCNELEKLVKEVVAEAGVTATVEKVSDLRAIAGLGVFTTPALVVDGVIKAAGSVPAKKDIAAWIA
ncbi:MAG: thioredoxin family protein [Solidesulfovibrio sp.]|jgi:small redox-active disulfide protein 2|uniref:thioredoxin family protein n=1 Tax=Solidesulfovibrio sp. TaxID=2910990 RepID=UPI002B21792D|nr:thioredoxin family protein [Solidesulfovibrio sp.]MEA4857019.1 thioredoxin family protein [Solidesulfovibrio sp.]